MRSQVVIVIVIVMAQYSDNILVPGSKFAFWDCTQHQDQCDEPRTNGNDVIKGSTWTPDGQDVFPQHIDSMPDVMTWKIWVQYSKYQS